jgi:hypothetical protein
MKAPPTFPPGRQHECPKTEAVFFLPWRKGCAGKEKEFEAFSLGRDMRSSNLDTEIYHKIAIMKQLKQILAYRSSTGKNMASFVLG